MTRIGFIAGAIALAALAGCGSKSPKSSGQATQVTATESEFKIQLSQQSFTAGAYTFVAENKGTLPHALEIKGPGVSNQRTSGTIAPGQSQTLNVTLQNGTYDIFCPIPGHKQQGMDVQITVGGAGAGMTTTTTSSGGGSGY